MTKRLGSIMAIVLLCIALDATSQTYQPPAAKGDPALIARAQVDDYIIGFNFENVFSETDVVVIEQNIGGVQSTVGTFRVDQMRHVAITVPERPSENCNCLEYQAIFPKNGLIGNGGGGVQLRITNAAGKRREGKAITFYKWAGLPAY